MKTDSSDRQDLASEALASVGSTLGDYPDISSAIAAVLAAAAPANAACGTLGELVASVIEESARAVRADPSGVRPIGIDGCWGPEAVMAVTEAVSDKCAELGGRSASADLVCASLTVGGTLATAREIIMHATLGRAAQACRRLADALDEKAGMLEAYCAGRCPPEQGESADLSGEFSGYAQGLRRVASSMEHCRDGANLSMLGAGEPGSGCLVPEDFALVAAAALSDVAGYEMVSCGNFRDGLAAVDRTLVAHAHMQAAAAVFLRLCRGLADMGGPEVARAGRLVAERVSASHSAMDRGVLLDMLGCGDSSVQPIRSLIDSGNLLVRAMDVLERRVLQKLADEPRRVDPPA